MPGAKKNSGGMFGGDWSFSGDMARNSYIPLAVVLVVVVLIVLVVYIIYKVKNKGLSANTLVSEPVKLFSVGDADVKDSNLKKIESGQEYTYSFWLYLLDFNNFTSDDRIVFMRGGDEVGDSISPLVFMDGKTNRLYITLGTNRTGESSVDSLSNFRPDSNMNYKMVTAVVEYVPLQRWVNVIFTVQENLLTVFLDGDMYSVKNVHDLWDNGKDGERPIFKGTSGSVHVGPTVAHPEAVNGYLSGLKVFNYTLMQSDAKSLYNKGPVSRGFLERLGIPAYGVQAPIYRIDGS